MKNSKTTRCSECRKTFHPLPRLASRQKTCGPECARSRQIKKSKARYRKNLDELQKERVNAQVQALAVKATKVLAAATLKTDRRSKASKKLTHLLEILKESLDVPFRQIMNISNKEIGFFFLPILE